MRRRAFTVAVLAVFTSAAACGPEPRRETPPREAEPPPVEEFVVSEEPASPSEDPPEIIPLFDDETEGLDLRSWAGSESFGTDAGTIALKGAVPQPFPPRLRDHLELLRGRGRATQEAVLAELDFLRDRSLPGGGWTADGAEPDLALTSLAVVALFSIGDAWTDRRAPSAAREACKWLSRDWLGRGDGRVPRDRPSHAPPDLRSQALFTLAVCEWRALSWVVYALDEGGLAVDALSGRVRAAYSDGRPLSTEDAATDAGWTLLALHVARLAEFDVGPEAADRILAVLERPVSDPVGDRTVSARSVARALGTAFHRPGATRRDVQAALQPAIEHSRRHPEDLERPTDRMFLASVAAMQVGGETARDWNRRVLRPLAARPRATDVRESALAAMCLSSYYRYSPATSE